ncbi:unnamed protein product [Caenorhabditis brenneri]
MNARFPLPKLPVMARQRVVQVMNIREILGFSLISKKCRKLTISSKIEGAALSVSIGNEINISFWTTRGSIFLTFYVEPRLDLITETDGRKTLKPPKSVFVYANELDQDLSKWENKKDFGMKKWLEHIHTVFDYHMISWFSFDENAFSFDIDYVKETFGNTEELLVENSGNYEYNESILKKYLPTESLSIESNTFLDSKIPPRILIQNFENLVIKYQHDGLECVSLDDLLMINSKYIDITTYQTPLKMLNKFVKLWKKGANPRMEYFEIKYHNGSETDVDEILDGIKCNEILQERPPLDVSVNKEFDIYRIDGMKATIRFKCSDSVEGMIQLSLFL